MLLKSVKNLLAIHKKGWIPGPKEEKDSFLARVNALDHFFTHPPEDVDHFLTDGDWLGARKKTEDLFGFSPDWIVAYYSNDHLSFFQGAATWITTQKDLRIPLIQLKKNFEHGSLHKLYRRDEVLSHEAVHAARMQFDEPFFEEFFAYKTSPRLWRRLLGPIFQRSWEAYLFVGLVFIPLALEISQFFYPDLDAFQWLSFLPLAFFALLFLRLGFLHLTLWLAMKRMKPFLQNPKKKWGAALFLTDREIFQLAFLPKKPLANFLNDQDNLRWDMLIDCYFKKIYQ